MSPFQQISAKQFKGARGAWFPVYWPNVPPEIHGEERMLHGDPWRIYFSCPPERMPLPAPTSAAYDFACGKVRHFLKQWQSNEYRVQERMGWDEFTAAVQRYATPHPAGVTFSDARAAWVTALRHLWRQP